MTDLCNRNGITHLFTGHHLEDNVENFVLRLIRGSGLIGLAQSNEHFFNNVRIIRPLFNSLKEELNLYMKNVKFYL